MSSRRTSPALAGALCCSCGTARTVNIIAGRGIIGARITDWTALRVCATCQRRTRHALYTLAG